MDSIHQTIVISGGGRGIGRATAILAGKRGWSVAVNYRSDADAAAETVAAVEAAGGRALAVQADVSREADVIALFDAAEAAFGRLDGVVVNAGVTAPSQPIAAFEAERIERVVRINLLGALFSAREAARRLPRPMDQRAASLVFVSSAAARRGGAFEFVDYAATKGALDTLTIGLSQELAPDNIRVNAVRPGLIATDIHASGGAPGRAERLAPTVPLARPGDASEVAEGIVWLLSDAASYTTGALLDITGGR